MSKLENPTWIILVSDSSLKMAAYGTPGGRPFKSEAQAQRKATELERGSSLDYLVLEVYGS